MRHCLTRFPAKKTPDIFNRVRQTVPKGTFEQYGSNGHRKHVPDPTFEPQNACKIRLQFCSKLLAASSGSNPCMVQRASHNYKDFPNRKILDPEHDSPLGLIIG